MTKLSVWSVCFHADLYAQNGMNVMPMQTIMVTIM
jgi:hypothetical protein